MLYGIGVDVTRLDRFAEKTAQDHFVQRVYGPQEQQELAGRSGHRLCQRLAGAWAAKEAFLKAAGRGLGGFALAEIQLLHLPGGRPCLQCIGKAGEWMRQNRLSAQVSVSHDGGICTAFVVLESMEKEKTE